MQRDMANLIIYILLLPTVGIREIHNTLHHISHKCISVILYKSHLLLYASLVF